MANNSKVIAIWKIYDEVARDSKLTGIPKSRLLELAWQHYTKTEHYAKLILGLSKDSN